MTTPRTPDAATDGGRVTTEVRDGIATIRFFHPKSNSLPATVLRALATQVTAAGENPDARVIVLASEGTGPFCAGASFDELRAIDSAEAGREFFSGFARVILAMIRAPKFVIARVHGKAVGGGVGVTAASDYAVATNHSSVKLSELAVGIGPFVVGPVIERKIGQAAFQQLAIDATEFRDPQWALRNGLYAYVAEQREEMDGVVRTLATRLARSNPEAMAEMKRIFWQGTEQWDALLAERAAMSGKLVLSDFTRDALAAFAAR